jgi:hypothetical protein
MLSRYVLVALGPHHRYENAEAGYVSIGMENCPEANIAIVFLNDTLADPQTQPGSFTELGGEEGFE